MSASFQIITLRTIGTIDGSFEVTGIFWLSVPVGSAVANQNFKSAFPGISPSDLALLQTGSIIEQPFSSRDAVAFTIGAPSDSAKVVPFQPNTPQDIVDGILLQYFNELQNRLNKLTPPLPTAAGRAFDGSKWNPISLDAVAIAEAGAIAKVGG